MQIYYINLASQPERRRALEQQLAALGLTATRVEAVTPADISPEDRRRYCDPKRHFWLTEAELACNLSHIAALQRSGRSRSSPGNRGAAVG
ncbi:MAG: glycosyltransferase family 25 protein [Devosia sp.]|nr:glycosyltransferase family 25 protein [Devosia sp.]